MGAGASSSRGAHYPPKLYAAPKKEIPFLSRPGQPAWPNRPIPPTLVGHEQGPRETFLTFDRLDLTDFDALVRLVVSVWLKAPTFDDFLPE